MCLWGAVPRREGSWSPQSPAVLRPAPDPGLAAGVAACRRHPSLARRSWLELQICLFWGFSTLVEGIGLRRRNFFPLKKNVFGLSLVVLGIPPIFLHGQDDSGTGGKQGAEMAKLVAADGEARDAGGRSFAQVRSLRPGAVRPGRAVCAPCPAPGNRWETSRERSLPGDSAPPTPPDASSGRRGPSLPPASA